MLIFQYTWYLNNTSEVEKKGNNNNNNNNDNQKKALRMICVTCTNCAPSKSANYFVNQSNVLDRQT